MAVLALSFLVIPVVRKQKKLTTRVWITAIAFLALAIGLYVELGRPDAAGHESAHEDSGPTRSRQAATTKKNPGSVQTC